MIAGKFYTVKLIGKHYCIMFCPVLLKGGIHGYIRYPPKSTTVTDFVSMCVQMQAFTDVIFRRLLSDFIKMYVTCIPYM